jgi:hypothetical protein
MEDLIDKLLILILIIGLPLSFYFTSKYSPVSQIITQGDSNINEVNQAIADLQTSLDSGDIDPVQVIIINKVSYASDTGILRIEGNAPIPKLTVMVSALVTKYVGENEGSSSAVMGRKVETFATISGDQGRFIFAKKLLSIDAQVVELRFEQGNASTTLQYDLFKQKRIF